MGLAALRQCRHALHRQGRPRRSHEAGECSASTLRPRSHTHAQPGPGSSHLVSIPFPHFPPPRPQTAADMRIVYASEGYSQAALYYFELLSIQPIQLTISFEASPDVRNRFEGGLFFNPLEVSSRRSPCFVPSSLPLASLRAARLLPHAHTMHTALFSSPSRRWCCLSLVGCWGPSRTRPSV